ncbi:MAG: hypothetical protein DMG62_23960, partial [Acidobacteria bacterium]
MKKKSTSQSAFFKLRLVLGVLLSFAGITLVLLAQPRTPSAQPGNSHPIVQAQFRGVLPVVKFDVSPPLRDMKAVPVTECPLREDEDREILAHLPPFSPVVPDPVVQRVLGKIGIPGPIVSFDGNSNMCGCVPPDPNGAVGPNHLMETSNVHFQIFDKNGTSLFGPV